MKYLTLRIWFLATITPVFIAIIIRIVWEVMVNPSGSGLFMSIVVILGLLGFYALIGYFTFKPNWKSLKSLPVGIGVTIMATSGLIGGIIHLIRFVPSPEVGLPWSLLIAVLYLLAGASAYLMLLWILWSTWKSRQKSRDEYG
ncbi:MAG: hypothetical protein ACE5KP_03265 [Dehalococcoidales bacterium]